MHALCWLYQNLELTLELVAMSIETVIRNVPCNDATCIGRLECF